MTSPEYRGQTLSAPLLYTPSSNANPFIQRPVPAYSVGRLCERDNIKQYTHKNY